MQIREALNTAQQTLQASSPSARLDAELLLGHVLGVSRVSLIASDQESLSDEQQRSLFALISKRAQHVPVAYLTGSKEFYGLEFIVNPSVLIPRPETEHLVEAALDFCKGKSGPLKGCDLGTGSGCIAISLVSALRQQQQSLNIVAIDKSASALEVAKANAECHGVQGEIDFRLGGWFEPVQGEEFDLIVSNPPYVELNSKEVSPETSFEPQSALYSGDSGLDAIFYLLRNVENFLKPAGIFLCECGHRQASYVREFVEQHAVKGKLSFLKDLSGIERIVCLRT